jgi:hypothetical protein
MWRVFYAFGLIALLSVVISVGGKWLGRSIALAGHTEDTTLRDIVIGNNLVSVPANAIRFERDRHDGRAERLDLYLHWPDMRGYSPELRSDFNNIGGVRTVIFLSIEQQMMSRDMSGRFDPIYRQLIAPGGTEGPAGLVYYGFSQKSGYMNEVLAVAERAGNSPFVARCLVGTQAEQSLAPCERDILVGDQLSLTYRFATALLAQWQALDAAMAAEAGRLIKSGKS